MRLIDDIIGKEILDYHANILGKVKDLEIDSASRKIESIIVTSDKNTEEKIPFEEVGSIGDKVILKESLSDLRDLLNI